MSRILAAIFSALLYFFAAMAIGGTCIAVHLWFAWGLTPGRIREGLAVMRGAPAQDNTVPNTQKQPEEPAEEPSYEAILQKRALEYRDLELKNKMLLSMKDDLENLRRQVEQKERVLVERERQFEALVARTRQEAEDAGRETVRRTLESIRPAQAKELITEMLDRKELDEVVRLMQGMNDSKRARIVAEFRTPEEAEKIAEVLRRLRQGSDLSQQPTGEGLQGKLPQSPTQVAGQ